MQMFLLQSSYQYFIKSAILLFSNMASQHDSTLRWLYWFVTENCNFTPHPSTWTLDYTGKKVIFHPGTPHFQWLPLHQAEKCCLSTRTWISQGFFHRSFFLFFPFYREDFSIPQTFLRVSFLDLHENLLLLSSWNWTAAGKPRYAFVPKDWCWEWTSLSILDELIPHPF